MQQESSEQLEHKIGILNRLVEISMVMNSTLQLEPLLNFIMESASEITASDGASVLLWNRNTNELFFAATTSGGAVLDLIGKPVPLEGSIAGSILRENRVIRVDDVRNHPNWFRGTDEQSEYETRSLLGLPMTLNERTIGVLEVVNKHELPWTEQDIHYLSILSAQAAVAIEVAQLVTALRKANQELSEIDKLKNDFIAIASHELRTPLGVIMGYASFLQDTTDTEVSSHATKVLDSAMHLKGIIEDLTNLRYLQQNQIELNREPVPIQLVVENAVNEMRNIIEARGHQLDVEVPPERIDILVDQGRINMALTNILNNSIRFTDEGGRISVAAFQRDANEVWIEISDSGVGIPEDQLERIFERFYQIEDHMTRAHGGLGIGLSIAKGMADAHGGRIWASSAGANQGATFTISLPLHE